MRMIMNVRIPHEPFNTLLREEKAGNILQKIIQDLKPESIFFTEKLYPPDKCFPEHGDQKKRYPEFRYTGNVKTGVPLIRHPCPTDHVKISPCSREPSPDCPIVKILHQEIPDP